MQQRFKQPTITVSEWLHGFKASNSQKMKAHVLNFFIAEGHYDLAQTFAREACIESILPAVEEEEVSRRDHIRKLILSNQIDDVISEARKVDQTVFENNLELLFALRCQKVVRLIKNQMFEEAITVAKEQLLPFAEKDPRYLEQIEKVMSLLAFVNTKECMSYELTTAQYRSKIADSMNEVLLGEDRRGQALNTLLNLGKWCAKRLQKHASFPKINVVASPIYSHLTDPM